jgi:hypothetical protein
MWSGKVIIHNDILEKGRKMKDNKVKATKKEILVRIFTEYPKKPAIYTEYSSEVKKQEVSKSK